MVNFRFFVKYDGTKYDGWQRQTNTEKTIQGKLETVLARLFGEPIEIQGSGRTDAGVHAKAQVANFRIKENLWKHTLLVKAWKDPVTEIEKYLNQYLPEDICVYGMEEASERFHSRLSAVGKTYCYRIWVSDRKPIFERKYVWWLPECLNIVAMRQSAGYLIGTHDFASFCGNPKMKKSTIRTIDSLEIKEESGILSIRVHGDGFLQNMVRILVGTLVEVGRGNLKADAISSILHAKKRTMAGPMAPCQGLCLESVDYDPPYDAIDEM